MNCLCSSCGQLLARLNSICYFLTVLGTRLNNCERELYQQMLMVTNNIHTDIQHSRQTKSQQFRPWGP